MVRGGGARELNSSRSFAARAARTPPLAGAERAVWPKKSGNRERQRLPSLCGRRASILEKRSAEDEEHTRLFPGRRGKEVAEALGGPPTAFAAEKSHEKPKFYPLIEFPYPSGAGLHVGHPRSNTAMDIIARKRRMEGYNVLFPIGYDAFGLPTENYAIKNRIHPAIVTEKNIARFRAQLKRIGFSFDYDREISTTDPRYYKWTQWIFLKLFEHGLAYKMEMPINWCTSCKVGLANEEVVGGALRALRRRSGAQGEIPVDAAHHRLRAEIARRPGRRGLHRKGQGAAAQLDRPLRGRGSGFHPHHRRQNCASSPRGRTRSLARPTWSCRPSIRSSSSTRRRSKTTRRSPPTARPPRARATLSARNSTRTRPAWRSGASAPSTPSTGRRSPCGCRTTC